VEGTEKNAEELCGCDSLVLADVGGSCLAVYPPTQAYARSILLIYKCWIGEFYDGKDCDFLKVFEEFLSSDFCPMKVKIPFECVRQRVMTKSQFKEPTSQIEVVDYSQFSLEILKESEDAVAIASTLQAMEGTEEKIYDDYDTGQDYDQSKPNIVVCIKKCMFLMVERMILHFVIFFN
jgi:hypothetical protein